MAIVIISGSSQIVTRNGRNNLHGLISVEHPLALKISKTSGCKANLIKPRAIFHLNNIGVGRISLSLDADRRNISIA